MRHVSVRTIDRVRRTLPVLRLTPAAMAIALFGAIGQADLATAEGRTATGQRECTLCIVGTPSVQWSGGWGSIHVDRVENRALRTTGKLALQVQLESTFPDPEANWGVGEYELSERVPLEPLPRGGSHSDIDSGTIAFNRSRVPAGEYFMIVMLLEDFNGRWLFSHYHDYVVMSDKVSCDGTNCAVVSLNPCSGANIRGGWGFTWNGLFLLPTGSTPAAAAGTFTIDDTLQVSGTQTSSVGGAVAQDVLKGSLTLNDDCTGALAVGLYDESGNLLRSAVWGLVFMEKGREVRGIFQSLVLPGGPSIPTIATAEGKRLDGAH